MCWRAFKAWVMMQLAGIGAAHPDNASIQIEDKDVFVA